MRLYPVLPLLLVMAATLTGCEHTTDSIAKLNDIPFGGTNEANIAAMVANPNDLVRGRGQDTRDGPTATAPIQRVQTDHEKKLLSPGGDAGGGSGGGGSGG
jgi:type IV pilus biogenesis protein CpaD/CtpE